MSGNISRLCFRVKAETLPGQSVRVCGSSQPLGSFETTNALALVSTPDERPYWHTKLPVVVPRGRIIHYRYCIFEAGVFKSFESIDQMRAILPTGVEHTIEETFDPQAVATVTPSTADMTALGLPSEDQSDKSRHPTSRLFIICYHLPVKIMQDAEGQWQFEWAESLIAKSEKTVAEEMVTYWVGTVSVSGDAEISVEMQQQIQAMLEPHNCIPVFIPKKLVDDHYLGYCKQVMWPVFHNVDQLDVQSAVWRTQRIHPQLEQDSGDDNLAYAVDVLADEEKWWEAYNQVNAIFAERTADMFVKDDVVWVHDYHLMLLPKMLDEILQEKYDERLIHIIFFLHIPMPTSQIFRSLQYANELLEGMVSADVVGFHAFDHARHFLNGCKRMLGLTYHTRLGGLIGVQYRDRSVIVTMAHVSIEPDLMDRALADPKVEEVVQDWKQKYPDKILMCGVDTCQRLNGVALKFAAFEKMLRDYPNWRGQVVLVQRSLRPSNRQADEEITSAELKAMVETINKEYGFVIDYAEVEGSLLPLNERLGLWKSCDVFLLTVIREGLNLLPCEYVYARKAMANAGVCLCSEFSTCASLLNGAIKINPFNARHVAERLDLALTMSEGEKAGRRTRDLGFVSSRPSSMWTRHVLNDMWTTSPGHADVVTEIDESRSHNLAEAHTMLDHTVPMERSIVRTAYTSCSMRVPRCSRVFVLDYGGTILEKEKYGIYIKQTLNAITMCSNVASQGRVPADGMMECLRMLSLDPSNVVMIITGLTKKLIEGIFDNLPNVCLVASNGMVFSWGRVLRGEQDTQSQRVWETLDLDVDWSEVRNAALPILNKFTARTNGSSISARDPGIGWSYFGTDPDWGDKQSVQLVQELETALSNFDVKIQHTKGMIEIVPRALDKGVFVHKFMDRVLERRGGGLPEFMLCMGDDPSDDLMFQAVHNTIAKIPADNFGLSQSRVFTCVVGKKPTLAYHYVNSVSDVEVMLRSLVSIECSPPRTPRTPDRPVHFALFSRE